MGIMIHKLLQEYTKIILNIEASLSYVPRVTKKVIELGVTVRVTLGSDDVETALRSRKTGQITVLTPFQEY